MDLKTLREAVVTQLQAAVPDDVHCDSTPGRFDLREFQRRSVRAPAVRVACMDMDIEHVGSGLGVSATVDMAAFVIMAGDRHQAGDERALLILSALLPAVSMATWGIECEPATDVRGRNLYSTDIAEKTGIALAAVTWRQTIELGVEDIAPGDAVRDVWLGFEPEAFPADYVHVIHEGADDA